jgi:hypothetical protein
MKKTTIFFVLVIMILGACSAPDSTVAQKIVGTWTSSSGGWADDKFVAGSWVFRTDGKVTRSEGSREEECVYAVTDTRLAIQREAGSDLEIFDISMSSDGKTLILLSTITLGTTRGNRLLTKQ